jgi:hypothetical protein
VILAQAAERERVNAWWIRSDVGMGLAMAALLAWSALAAAWFGRAGGAAR